MKKRFYFLLLFCVLPLAVGAGLYFLLRPETCISRWFYAAFSLSPPDSGGEEPRWLCLLKNYASDGLWGFALTAAVTCVTEKSGLGLGISAGFEIVTEGMQLFPAFRGTFDGYDIAVEIAASLLCTAAIQIWKHKEKEKKNEKAFDQGNCSSAGAGALCADGHGHRRHRSNR